MFAATAWVEDGKNVIQSAASVTAGVWFLVQWFLRRQLDAAIDFEVETIAFPE